MTKATVTNWTTITTIQGRARISAGGSKITENLVHFTTTGLTVHAEDVDLKSITNIVGAIPDKLGNWAISATIQNRGSLKNFASFQIASLRSGGTVNPAGTAQDWLIAIEGF